LEERAPLQLTYCASTRWLDHWKKELGNVMTCFCGWRTLCDLQDEAAAAIGFHARAVP
jgi:hypothetical protein